MLAYIKLWEGQLNKVVKVMLINIKLGFALPHFGLGNHQRILNSAWDQKSMHVLLLLCYFGTLGFK